MDHADQLDRLRDRLGLIARLRVSECLDVCERANVIVVGPSPSGRAEGGRPVWLGLVGDPGAIEDITNWVGAGGPGIAEPPDCLDLYQFTPPRRVRIGTGLD